MMAGIGMSGGRCNMNLYSPLAFGGVAAIVC